MILANITLLLYTESNNTVVDINSIRANEMVRLPPNFKAKKHFPSFANSGHAPSMAPLDPEEIDNEYHYYPTEIFKDDELTVIDPKTEADKKRQIAEQKAENITRQIESLKAAKRAEKKALKEAEEAAAIAREAEEAAELKRQEEEEAELKRIEEEEAKEDELVESAITDLQPQLEKLVNNMYEKLHYEDSPAIVVSQLNTASNEILSKLTLLLMGDKKRNNINTCIKKFNEAMIDITDETSKQCNIIMTSILENAYEPYIADIFSNNMNPSHTNSPSNQLSKITDQATYAILATTVSTFFERDTAKQKLMTAMNKNFVKESYSKYLTFLCHETFRSKIRFDGNNITLEGGNINYSQSTIQYKILSQALYESISENEDKISSLKQQLYILNRIVGLYDIEMSVTFNEKIKLYTGTENVDVRLENHLHEYVESIRELLPRLSQAFPVQEMHNEEAERMVNAQKGIETKGTERRVGYIKHSENLTKIESDLKNNITTNNRKNFKKSWTEWTKSVTGFTAAVPLAAVTGVTDEIMDTGVTTVKTLFGTLNELIYAFFLKGPLGVITILIILYLAPTFFAPVTVGFDVARTITSTSINISSTVFTIVKLPFQYVYTKISGRHAYRSHQQQHQGYQQQQQPQQQPQRRERMSRFAEPDPGIVRRNMLGIDPNQSRWSNKSNYPPSILSAMNQPRSYNEYDRDDREYRMTSYNARGKRRISLKKGKKAKKRMSITKRRRRNRKTRKLI
jgi:hypothetical protein